MCFWKGKTTDFDGTVEPKMNWHTLTNDQSIGVVKESFKAGLIQFKLSIHNTNLNSDANFESKIGWREPPPRFYTTSRLRCYIYQCKDLPSADADGASDSRVTIYNPVKEANLKEEEHIKRSSTSI